MIVDRDDTKVFSRMLIGIVYILIGRLGCLMLQGGMEMTSSASWQDPECRSSIIRIGNIMIVE
jgi:hypothetical protein